MNVHNSTNHNNQKQETTQLSTNGFCTNKMGYIHTMKYESAIKRNRVLIHALMYHVK